MTRDLLLIGSLVLVCAPIRAAEPNVIRIPFVKRPPTINDFVKGAAREAEARVTDFRQRVPNDGNPISMPTRAYLSYDRKMLYIAFVCEEDRGRVRTQMAPREQIDDDDAVVVMLDTFHSRQRYYRFYANPSGVQKDSVTTEGLSEDPSFDTVWNSEARITRHGYIVLVSIPFRNLRFPDRRRQEWGIALGRRIFRNGEWSYWPHLSTHVEGFSQQFGSLIGLESVSSGRNIRLAPYVASTNARLLNQTAGVPAFESTSEVRAGVDAKVVLKDAVTLDLTLNPDFSQVESNDPQVTINKRFETFFPEMRPFFVENADYFQTPLNLFFSRRVLDPGFGARLTGKLGHWSFGILGTNDRQAGQVAEDQRIPTKDERAVIGVARAQYEFGDQSRFGVLLTSRDLGAESNRVGAVDARIKLSRTWLLTAQAGSSLDRVADGKKLTGPFYQLQLSKTGRHFNYESLYSDISPNFRTQLGYIPRVDIRQTQQTFSYYFWLKDSVLQSFGPSATVLYNMDHSGRVQDKTAYANFALNFKSATNLTAGRYEAYEYYLGRGFRYGRTDISFFSGALRWLSIYGSASKGEGVNYNPSAGVAPFLGHSLDTSSGFSIRPTGRFRLDGLYLYSWLGGPLGEIGQGPSLRVPSVYNNHLFRLKANYQLTRALSFRTIFDYNSTLPNSGLIAQEKYKAFRGDYLITYLVHPGTALYIGYSDLLENYGLLPDGRSGMLPFPSSRNARQFYIKLKYLLDF